MPYVRALPVLFASFLIGAAFVVPQSPAQTQPDTNIEMPGVFRISLPPGWQQTKVLDDRHTLAAFSNKELTLEVIRDSNSASAEQYAQIITERRLLPEADEYPGKYAPAEVRSNPASFVAEVTRRFDEYTLLAGLPAQWARYHWHYSHPVKEGEPAKADDTSVPDAIVWSVFTLTPDAYWRLELRGDERANWPSDLRRMIRSFQLLEPMASQTKALVPKEAWGRVPSNLADGTCQFVGIGSGMGAVLPCDWDVIYQVQNETPQDATKLAVIGSDQLKGGSRVSVSFKHIVVNWSADKILQVAEQQVSGQIGAVSIEAWNGKYGHWQCDYENEDEEGYVPCHRSPKTTTEKLQYHRDDLRRVTVDGYPGTLITATGTATKSHKKISYRLLAVSKGTDHFLVNIVFNPSACTNCPVDQILSSIRLFALQPTIQGVVEKILARLDTNKLVDSLLAQPAAPPAPPTSQELDHARESVRLFNDSQSHFQLGELLDRTGKPDDALAEFKTAARLNPRNDEVNRKIGQIYASSNEIENAIAAYERILYYGADPDKDESSHAQLASLYAQGGNNVLAVNHLAKVGTKAPQNMLSDADMNAANKQLEELGAQREKANKDYESNPTPENSLADAELGLRVGDFPGGDRICRRVHEQDPKNLRALACLADTSYIRGEGDSAIEYAQQWLALSPNDPLAYYWLARGYSCEPADYKKVADSYESVVRRANEQLQPWALHEAQVWWPKAYEESEMWQEAAKAHEAVARLFPGDAQVLNATAWFYATTTSKMKSPAKALEYAKRAVGVDPKDPNILDTLAEAYFVNGRVDDAVATEQKALALAANREDLLKQMKKFKQAKRQRTK